MSLTVVHLLRHGEVDNPEGVLYARLPGFHLSATGRAMAARVGERLRERGADLAYIASSPLERAQETTIPIATAFEMEFQTDSRLIEAENALSGQRVDVKALATTPRWWPLFTRPWVPSWGESYAEQRNRMRWAVTDAARIARGREALLVSHQSPIWTFRSWIEGRSHVHNPNQRQCALASLTSFTFDGGTLVGWSYEEPAADLVSGPVAAQA